MDDEASGSSSQRSRKWQSGRKRRKVHMTVVIVDCTGHYAIVGKCISKRDMDIINMF
jgi:C4-type Zn-finger protein